MGMEGDDVIQYLLDQDVLDIDILADLTKESTADSNGTYLCFITATFLRGRMNGMRAITNSMTHGTAGLLLGSGADFFNPEDQVVVVGLTPSSLPRLLFGDPLKLTLKAPAEPHRGPGLRVMVTAAMSLEDLQKKVDTLNSLSSSKLVQ